MALSAPAENTNGMKVNVAIVGFGYWGPNVARNFVFSTKAAVSMICDANPERLAVASGLYPAVTVTPSFEQVLANPDVDLIVLATPVSTHFPLGIKALHAGKHLLIEKPMTSSAAQARDLLSLARKKNLRVFVDHTFVFSPQVNKMKDLVAKGELGDLLYYDSSRINLGLFQHDVDVVWDLLPHDLSILDFLLEGELPETVSCWGASHFSDLADQAYVSLSYRNRFIAHVHVNWIAPVKIRQVLLCGDKKMIVFDETSVEKLRVYDRGVNIKTPEDVYKRLVQYREGDMSAPHIPNYEALAAEVDNVLETISGNQRAIVDGNAGHRVVLLLEAASESLKNNGRPVIVERQTGTTRIVRRKTDELSA